MSREVIYWHVSQSSNKGESSSYNQGCAAIDDDSTLHLRNPEASQEHISSKIDQAYMNDMKI